MGCSWAAEIPRAQVRYVGLLRECADLEAGRTETAFWVRGPDSEGALSQLRLIPHARLFHLQDNNELRPWGRYLVDGVLPPIEFRPIGSVVEPVMPTAGYPTARLKRVDVSLIRSQTEQSATLLITSQSEWASYAVSAPKIRLRRWTFAVSDDGRVLVRGNPLPPLDGEQYWETEGVAIRVGWECSPALHGPVLQSIVGHPPGGLVLLHTDGSSESVPETAFVTATRSAVRETMNQ